MSRVNELKQLLMKYDEQYYNQQVPLISDAEYDKLKEEYLLLGGKDFVSGKINNGNKVKHKFYASSLNKVKVTDKDKLRKMITELFPVVIEYKFDGLTMVDYGDTFVSRGDGELGEDKTDKKQYIKGIGTYFDMPIRGEVMMTKSDFEKVNSELSEDEKLSNCRNGASGMMNRKNITPKGLIYFAYYVHGVKNPLEQMKLLKEHGYNCIEGYVPKTIDDAINYIETFDKSKLDFDIDGLVVKSLQNKDFGETEHHPKNAFAVKAENESKFTKLLDIEWNVGKTGIVSPVAIFEPVELNGAIVERATLHNMDYIKGLGLEYICFDNQHSTYVEVIRSNEVIPKIVSIKNDIDDMMTQIKEIDEPKVCPICESTLENVNGLLYCRNPYCKEKVIAQAIHTCSRECLDIRGLSEETIRKMYNYCDNEYKKDFTFPLYFRLKDIIKLDGFARKSAQTLSDEIESKLSNVEFKNFLNACNIPLLGKKASKDIASKFSGLDELKDDVMNYHGRKLMTIDGVGEELYKSLYNNFNNILSLLNVLIGVQGNIQYNTKQESSNVLQGKTFVITGSLVHFKNRSELVEKIELLGGKVSGSISKNTSYLINNDKESTSSKNKKAKDLDVKIISEQDFIDMID